MIQAIYEDSRGIIWIELKGFAVEITAAVPIGAELDWIACTCAAGRGSPGICAINRLLGDIPAARRLTGALHGARMTGIPTTGQAR